MYAAGSAALAHHLNLFRAHQDGICGTEAQSLGDNVGDIIGTLIHPPQMEGQLIKALKDGDLAQVIACVDHWTAHDKYPQALSLAICHASSLSTVVGLEPLLPRAWALCYLLC